MTIASEAKPPRHDLQPETRIVLRGIGWDLYGSLVESLGEQHVRLTYDRGGLELMSPSPEHEIFGTLLGRMVEILTQVLRIRCIGLGSTTWRCRLKERGLEADKCFYIRIGPVRRVGDRTIDLSASPPPSLAIEVEISRSALDRMGIYSALGVPEVWRFDGEHLRSEWLQDDGSYVAMSTSRNLPFFSLEEAVRWISLAQDLDDHSEWANRFQGWVQAELSPRHREGRDA